MNKNLDLTSDIKVETQITAGSNPSEGVSELRTEYFERPEGKLAYPDYGGRLVLIEGAGHYPQTEMPEKTAPVVLEFLRQV